MTTQAQPLAPAPRLQRIDSPESRRLVSEATNLLELSSLPGTCSMSRRSAARPRHSELRTPKNPLHLVPHGSRAHHDSVKPKTPKTRESLRHLDSRASAPRAPKDSDTSAPETQHSMPKRTSRASSLKCWRQEPRRAPTPQLQGLDPLRPKEPQAPQLQRASAPKTPKRNRRLELREPLAHRTPNPKHLEPQNRPERELRRALAPFGLGTVGAWSPRSSAPPARRASAYSSSKERVAR
jgi:hypothetical protein